MKSAVLTPGTDDWHFFAGSDVPPKSDTFGFPPDPFDLIGALVLAGILMAAALAFAVGL